MKYGFENNKFFIDFKSSAYPHGTVREESEKRARDIAEYNNKNLLCFTGGLDSQSVLHSFHTQGIPLETVFLYLPTYNDNEFEQVKIIDKKYGIKTQIIDFDPMSCKDEIEQLSIDLDILGKNHLLQRKFVSLLPTTHNVIQCIHDLFVYISPTNNRYFCQGYHLTECSRQRALDSLGRIGKNIIYGDTPEFTLSIIDDDIFRAALHSAKYFDENNASIPDTNLKTTDRFEYYIKPLLYGKYWKDELIYFPKYKGFEKIKYLNEKNPKTKKHVISVPYNEMISFLKTPGSITKRYYENVPYSKPVQENILAEEYTKHSQRIVIKQTSDIKLPLLHSFISSQVNKLYENGFRQNLDMWPNNKGAIYAEVDNQIIGVIVYNAELEKQNNLIWLVVGAVDENYQNQGIYSLMRKHFEAFAKNMNFDGVASLIHKNNNIAIQSATNLGGNIHYHYFVKTIN